MRWINLKTNKCPKCSVELSFENKFIVCSCGFKITENRMTEILNNIERRKLKTETSEALMDLYRS